MSWYNIYIHLFPKRLVPQKYLGFYWAIHRWFGGTPFVFFRLRKAPGDPPRHGLKSRMLEAAWIALRRSWEYFWMISSIWVRSKSSELGLWAGFFWGKFLKFEALEALEALEPVRWGLKFDVQWCLSETWRPDWKLIEKVVAGQNVASTTADKKRIRRPSRTKMDTQDTQCISSPTNVGIPFSTAISHRIHVWYIC